MAPSDRLYKVLFFEEQEEKSRMKKLKILWNILKTTSADKIVIGFIGFILMVAGIIQMVEPSMTSYGDALWYCFIVITTIGFGDFYAITLIGRVATIILAIYGIFVVALIPGIVVSFYMEFIKIKANESTVEFLEKLERLDELSKEELTQISKNVRDKKYNIRP